MSTVSLPSPPVLGRVYVWALPSDKVKPWASGAGVGRIKVGYTTRTNVMTRINESLGVNRPWDAEQPELLLNEVAYGNFGGFKDHDVHAILEKTLNRARIGGEWFEATVDDVHAAINMLRTGAKAVGVVATKDAFPLRPEQQVAVEQTAEYLSKYAVSKTGRTPAFLWNAKMRFGKTFTTYQLAKKMGWTRILVLTYKPAVQSAWREDLISHQDFDSWQFIGSGQTWDECVEDETRPVVWFSSFQDVLGSTSATGIKERHEEMSLVDWDAVVLDEYHFGSWRDGAKELYDELYSGKGEEKDVDDVSVEQLHLNSANYLYLSGTPFRSLINGEFTEDQTFSWTYADEQRAKAAWTGTPESNPYRELPAMRLMTYQLPDAIRSVAENGNLNAFDMNEFFKVSRVDSKKDEDFRFTHELEVQKWLDLIRGAHIPYDASLQGNAGPRPPLPFEDTNLLGTLRHNLWFLPNVGSCFAMKELLSRPQNNFYHKFRVHVAAGNKAGLGLAALPPVERMISGSVEDAKGLNSLSITLSCGKLMTGVSVPQWSGIFMLNNLSSPETYFQAAFRVQTPWTAKQVDPEKGAYKEVLKDTCYVFDFSPNRALSLVAEYATQLSTSENREREEQVSEFLNFLPVLCYDGYSMQQLDAGPLLDFAVSGTSASMLARRWESTRLIDVSSATLKRLLEDAPDLVDRLSNMESFRNLRDLKSDLTRTISKDETLQKLKAKEKSGEKLTPEESVEAKEAKEQNQSLRKKLQENLIKFAARIPVFMYLTDEREETLHQVITAVEPALFQKVTNLTVADFKLMCELGLFHEATMSAAVYAFRRYEDSSLDYAGGGLTEEEKPAVYGGFKTSYTSRIEVTS